MGKFFKISITLVVFLVILFSVGSYFNVGMSKKDFTKSSDCSTFTMKTDAKSKKNIEEIVTTLANTSTFGLAFKSRHLKQLGKEVDHKVPSPLSFLAIIFSDPKLVKAMKQVQKSSFKYDNFCEGLYKNMMISYRNERCFKKNITAFSKALHIHSERTFTVAKTCGRHGEDGDKDAFRPFVDYLLENKS